jgi:hypothetical protein
VRTGNAFEIATAVAKGHSLIDVAGDVFRSGHELAQQRERRGLRRLRGHEAWVLRNEEGHVIRHDPSLALASSPAKDNRTGVQSRPKAMTMSLRSRWLVLASPATVVAAGSIARADVIPPPTLVVDFFWLGVPVGPVVGLALLVGAVFFYRRMRRAGRGRLRAGATVLAVFAACNLACYVWGIKHRRGYHPPYVGRTDGTVNVVERPADARR